MANMKFTPDWFFTNCPNKIGRFVLTLVPKLPIFFKKERMYPGKPWDRPLYWQWRLMLTRFIFSEDVRTHFLKQYSEGIVMRSTPRKDSQCQL